MKPSKTASLAPSRERVKRANEHLDQLARTILRAETEKEYGIFPERDEYTDEGLIICKFPSTLQLRLGIIAGDIAHQLRSALDNLVWQLALANGKNPGPENAFPIFTEVVKYAEKVGTNLQGLSRGAQTHIEGLQPYHARNDPTLEPLWVLHEINNWDKHRVPHLTVVDVHVVEFEFPDLTDHTIDVAEVVRQGLRSGPFEDGAEIGRFMLPKVPATPPFEVKVNYKATAGIAFDKSGPGKGKPLHGLMSTLTTYIDKTVDDFAVHFPPPAPPQRRQPPKPMADPANPTAEELRARGLHPEAEIRPPGALPRFPKKGKPE